MIGGHRCGAWRFRLRDVPPVPPQALAAFHMSVGLAILGGGEDRFAGPSFKGARALAGVFIGADQAWLLWGAVLTAIGAGILFTWPALECHRPRLAIVAVTVGAVPMLFLGLGFVLSLPASSVASTSGIGAYGALGIAHIHTAVKAIAAGVWDRPTVATNRRWHP